MTDIPFVVSAVAGAVIWRGTLPNDEPHPFRYLAACIVLVHIALTLLLYVAPVMFVWDGDTHVPHM